MTIAYDAFEAALLTWLENVTGLPCFWEERDQTSKSTIRTFGLLNVLADQNVGIDDYRIGDAAIPAPGAELEAVVSGQRLVTVSVRVKSRSQRPLQTGRYHLSKAHTSLRDPEVRELYLVPASISVVRIAALQNLDFTENRRRVSLAAMDVTFSTTAVRTSALTYIEKIRASTAWKNAGGLLLPASLQLDEEVLP